jgi:hypothetical protein
MIAAFERDARTFLGRAAVIMQREAKVQLSRPGRGQLHPGLRRRSSAPGEPPAAQTGTLRRSVQIDRSRIGQLWIRVGTNLPYGAMLEKGYGPFGQIVVKRKKVIVAGRGSKAVFFGKKVDMHPGILPRPWLRPAARKAKRKIDRIWREGRLSGRRF